MGPEDGNIIRLLSRKPGSGGAGQEARPLSDVMDGGLMRGRSFPGSANACSAAGKLGGLSSILSEVAVWICDTR